MTKAMIEIDNLQKWYGDQPVLRGLDLTVAAGEKVVVLGPSGSGKSTLIRTINGLESHQGGTIRVDGMDLAARGRPGAAARRASGMVFQAFNLFPHLTVLDNCALAPMRVLGLSRAEAKDRAMALLERVRIAGHAHKYPVQLSAASNSAPPSPGPWPWPPRSCSSTSPPRRWIRKWSVRCWRSCAAWPPQA